MSPTFQKNHSADQITTQDNTYTERLFDKQYVWWKRMLDVQRPYRRHLRRLKPGFILDIGCGIGRNLIHINGNGVGIDHNRSSVEMARAKGLSAFTAEEFHTSAFNVPERFDTILLAHVAEHMTKDEVVKLLNTYIHLLKPQGRVMIITPQESGYRSDQTHVQFMDFSTLNNIIQLIGATPIKHYSFPFPRIFGRFFKYNEFVSIAEKK
ncbi:MAG TPA: methyltransferase domain-containing protein [Bacteroidales bacterium]|nr:methyltransferase domain-containing protein [Bacteroidales bacterium]